MPAETHVERGPLDRGQVFELIRDRLADILEIEPSAIKEGDSFVDDLDERQAASWMKQAAAMPFIGGRKR